MATYCYTDENGRTIERYYPIGSAPRKIKIGGTVYYHDLGAEQSDFRYRPDLWRKFRSDALGVLPSQVEHATADAREKGLIGVEFLPDGTPEFHGRKAHKDYCEAYGFYHRNGGYGDPQKR